MVDDFEKQAEAFFATLPALMKDAGRGAEQRVRVLRAAMADAGLVGFGIPEAYGGRTDVVDGPRRFQIAAQGRLPTEDGMLGIGLNMAVPIIMQYGTEELKQYFVRRALRARAPHLRGAAHRAAR